MKKNNYSLTKDPIKKLFIGIAIFTNSLFIGSFVSE